MSTDPGTLAFVVSVVLVWLAIGGLLKLAVVLARRSRSRPVIA